MRRDVLSAPKPIVLIEAPAGMGKSVLLGQLAKQLGVPVHCSARAPAETPTLTLWDIPPGSLADPLPESFASGRHRIVVAKRPETPLQGLDRASLYGHVHRFGTAELLFDRDELQTAMPARLADRTMEQSGGWPILVGRPPDDGEEFERFLADELLAPMTALELVSRSAWFSGQRIDMTNVPLLPLLELTRPALAGALPRALQERHDLPGQAAELAVAYATLGFLTEAIITWQSIGCLDEALKAFIAGGGRFYLYRHGAGAFDRVLAGFPSDYAAGNDTLVMSLAMQALKHGEVARARQLLADRFGNTVNDVRSVFTSRDRYSTDLIAFRVVMLIYEDYQLTDELFEQVFSTLGDISLDDHIVRGSFYNAVLEFYIRRRRLAAAEDVARRALFHYERAHVPMLSFYISLHQALMRLLTGDAINARGHAEQAARYLHAVNFESPGTSVC